MTEYLAELVQRADPTQKRNVAREYLQARILECLQRAGAIRQQNDPNPTGLRMLVGVFYGQTLRMATKHRCGVGTCNESVDPRASCLRHIVPEQGTSVEIDHAHRGPRSSMTI
jgi:hypothetical protein